MSHQQADPIFPVPELDMKEGVNMVLIDFVGERRALREYLTLMPNGG